MNVVIFTGGSGNANLIRFVEHLSHVKLSLLINGYDDGLSTGTIRSANQGMLGPSDFRKNFTYILDDFSTSNQNVKTLFEYRLDLHDCSTLLNNQYLFTEQIFENKKFDPQSKEFIQTYLSKGITNLLSYTKDINKLNNFSLGNIIIGGLYNEYKDFNKALKVLTDFFDLNARLTNVSRMDDSKLVAFDNKTNFISNEADIVNYNGDKPLKEFYLLPYSRIQELDNDKDYTPDILENLAIVPEISADAKEALLKADLIIFGSGTLFSSLLPSYRICGEFIQISNARKVLIVNNEYDNDIKNIELDEYIDLIMREFPGQDAYFFDRIVVDQQSKIIQNNKKSFDYPNLINEDVANQNRKHNGYKLWSTITKSIVQINGKHLVKIIPSEDMSEKTKQIYRQEIEEYNKNSIGDIEFFFEDEKTKNFNYYLILDTSGKINLEDIKIWIDLSVTFNFECIFGSRFYSRRQMILSFKKRLVESKGVYFISLLTSHVVSFFHFLRFFIIISDPFSGIYLIKADQNFQYKGVPKFLKYIHKNRIKILSLPISYRTFKEVNYLKKSASTIKNIIKLFI